MGSFPRFRHRLGRLTPLLAVLALPSCFYAGGHHWRLFSRQPKETIDIPDTLGVPRLRQQLSDRSSQKISNLEVWTAVDWNEKLRREGRSGVATRERYHLAPGDRISVQVADEKELSKDYYIRPDGTFSFPWLNEVHVEGKTIPEVQDLLRQGLLDFMKDPQVTVNLEQGPSRIVGAGGGASPDFGEIMIFGEVGGGTGVTVSGGGIGARVLAWSGKETLLKVLARSGGLSGAANWRNVAVFRREADPEVEGTFKTLVIVSDMSNYFKRVDHEQDIPLKVNDVVFVPTQPEYIGKAFKHDWDLLLGYLGGIVSYDDFVRRTSDSSRIMPRSGPHTRGVGD